MCRRWRRLPLRLPHKQPARGARAACWVGGGSSSTVPAARAACALAQRPWACRRRPAASSFDAQKSVPPPTHPPVVHVAERVWHVGLALVVPPLAIHNEFVLVVAAAGGRGPGQQQVGRQAGSRWAGLQPSKLQRLQPPAAHQASAACALAGYKALRTRRGRRAARTHPGGRCTTTANVPGCPSTSCMGTVSTHRVKEPQRWTCACREAGVAAVKPCQRRRKHGCCR